MIALNQEITRGIKFDSVFNHLKYCHVCQPGLPQTWCLLSLFSILVGDRAKNPLDDEVWQSCLKLREIVDLIIAPKIHTNQVAYMKILTEEYIQLKTAAFTEKTLKPKHHYRFHYLELILLFGPLIRLWTLCFESKHSYFKQCARKLHNF